MRLCAISHRREPNAPGAHQPTGQKHSSTQCPSATNVRTIFYPTSSWSDSLRLLTTQQWLIHYHEKEVLPSGHWLNQVVQVIHRTQIIFLQADHQKICRFEVTTKLNYENDTRRVKIVWVKRRIFGQVRIRSSKKTINIQKKLPLFLKIISSLLIIWFIYNIWKSAGYLSFKIRILEFEL